MPTAQRPMTVSEWGLLLFLSLLWGGSFFFVGVAVKALPPFTIVAARVGIAAALLWSTARLTGMSPRAVLRHAPALALLGLLNNALPFALIVWGQTQLASGLAAILNASTPIFTVILAHFVTTTERLTWPRFCGAALGLAGVAAMMDGASLGADSKLWAEIAVLGAAVSYACASLYARGFRARGLAPIDIATGQVTAAALILLPVAVLFDRPWALPAPGLAPIAALLAIGAFSTALAYVVYFRILAGAGATNVVLVTLLAPVTSILLGALALGERLETRHFLGLALIAGGLALIDGRVWIWSRGSPASPAPVTDR
jgi:drug/metabolite transporter (DMT)-like permease